MAQNGSPTGYRTADGEARLRLTAKTTHRLLVLLTLVAVPAAWGLEQLILSVLLPAEFGMVRAALRGPLTQVSWGLFFGTAVLALSAERLGHRALRRQRDDGAGGPRRATATFLWTSSLPQLPAAFATLSHFFGAPLLPVFLALMACSTGILILGWHTCPPGLEGGFTHDRSR